MNGNLSKEGITADLEAMKWVGGVQVFNVDYTTPRGPVDFMSPAWLEMVRFAKEEAARLGISFSMMNCAGWSNSGGRLVWDVPAGNWTILRLGYTPTDQFNHPAPPVGDGLECDKFSAKALHTVWNGMIQKVLDDGGPLAGKGMDGVLIDSWEVGTQQWSPVFAEAFTKRCGYDPTPWLPVLSGRIEESRELSHRFLWDVRRTASDLIVENYFGEATRLCRACRCSESAGGNPDRPELRPQLEGRRRNIDALHGRNRCQNSILFEGAMEPQHEVAKSSILFLRNPRLQVTDVPPSYFHET